MSEAEHVSESDGDRGSTTAAHTSTEEWAAESAAEDGVHKKERGHQRKMDRITFRLPRDQLDEIQKLVDDDQYPNTSVAMRSAVDAFLADARDERSVIATSRHRRDTGDSE